MLHVASELTLNSHMWQTRRLLSARCLSGGMKNEVLPFWTVSGALQWTTTTSKIMMCPELHTAPAANCVEGDGCALLAHTEPISFSGLLHLSFLNAFIWNSLCRPFWSWVHTCLIKPAVVPFRSPKVRYKPNLYVTASSKFASMN